MDVLVDGEILLFGTVGDFFWGDGFTALDVIDALSRIGRGNDVTVRLNSGGGIATEGVAIFNALKAHRGAVDIVVEAIAASAASLIAMAGETVTMRTGAVMMIHDPSAITIGTSADHEKSVEALEALASGYADIYAEKSGKTAKQTRVDMKAETWLTAAEAVNQGYADEVDSAAAPEPTAFDFRIYQKPPERLAALAAAKGWNFSARATNPKETAMPAANPAAPAATASDSASNTIISGLTAALAWALGRPATAEAAPAVTLPAPAPVPAVVALTAAETAEIVTLATAAGVPAMAAALITEKGMTLAIAKTRIDGAKDIKAAVDLARKSHPQIEASLADGYIRAGTSIETVRADLFARMTALGGGETRPQNAAAASEDQNATNALWDEATAKVNREHGFDKSGRRAA